MVLFKAYLNLSKFGILKNSKQILINKHTGKSFIAKSGEAMRLEAELIQKLRIEKLKQRLDTIACDVNAKFVFHFPKTVFFTKKNERSLKLPDLSNLIAMPEDCLQKAEIILNDNLICSLDGCSRIPNDSIMYFLEIELSKHE